MTRTGFIVMLLIVSGLLPATAQTRRIAYDEAVSGRLAPETLRQLQWRPGTASYVYVDPASQHLMQASGKDTPGVLLTLDDLNRAMPEPLARFPLINWISGEQFWFNSSQGVCTYDLSRQVITQHGHLPADMTLQEPGPGMQFAGIIGDNIHAGTLETLADQVFTTDGSRDISYGAAAHRNEFGIKKGFFWSPDGQRLAFYRIDQTTVTDYPLVTYEATPAAPAPDKYPMAGGPSQVVTVGILTPATGQIVYLQTGEPADQYLTNITWHPDGIRLYIAHLNRDQNHLQLAVYDTRTGARQQILFEEKHAKYVEPEEGPLFLTGNPEQFIWHSERDGYTHLYLYETSGKLIRQLTRGEWEVTRVLGYQADKQWLVIQSTAESPVERHLYAVPLDGGQPRRLSRSRGFHQGLLSTDGRYLLDQWSSVELPGATDLMEVSSGKTLREIHRAPNPLANHLPVTINLFQIPAQDGTPLYCRMIRPSGFVETTRYPVLVYLYGGPHNQLVQDRWLGGADLFLISLAQQGYVVFTLDNRGSSFRGQAFEQATFRQLGTREIEDQLTGVSYLKRLPYVDTTRLGVYGWSYGGFMATSMMVRTPGVFKVGVAGGPVIDWKWYEVMYTERYMDTPQTNPEGYQKASLLQYAGSLVGDLLIIQGLQDNVVVPQHSTSFIKTCIDKKIQLDYFTYPDHAHNVLGADRAHLFTLINRYLDQHLK
ncbi:MAG: DPP IV N-terminal domain-containing protein [Bacteroidia bacterium]|nr:DPP IV N-terminal domain-containing protein [Bacteroidia bacterium]